MMAKRRRARKEARRTQQGSTGDLSSKNVQKAMNKLNVKSLSGVIEVIVKLEDHEIILTKPEIQIMKHEGNDVYMINSYESSKNYYIPSSSLQKELVIKESDVQLVMKQAKVDAGIAERALQESQGDLAKAVMSLTK